MSICGLFFGGTHMQQPFCFFLDIFTPKTFLLHAVYVEFHLPGTLKLLYYALLCVCVIYMYIYIERESQIVHPTPQCFKSFYPVYFVNDS